MKISELKKILTNVPDNFEFKISIARQIPEEELTAYTYAYPFTYEKCTVEENDYDTAWSDKCFTIHVTSK